MLFGRAQAFRLAILCCVAAAPAASAGGRLKIGPFELLPSLALEIRQHSNIYVTSDQQKNRSAEVTQTGGLTSPTADVSDLVIDLRPGLNLLFKPKIQKKIRGLYFDLKYNPSIALFPNAPVVCGFGEPEGCAVNQADQPDSFKIDHNVQAGLRYQAASRLTFSSGVDYSHPELSRAEVSLDDLRAFAGFKYDVRPTISLVANYRLARFRTPTERFVEELDGTRRLVEEDTPFGTFEERGFDGTLSWRWRPTLTLAAHYERSRRTFDGLPGPASPELVDPRDFAGLTPSPTGGSLADGIIDSVKDHTQQSASLLVTKRLTRQTRGTVEFGYLWRDNDRRQFGAARYSDFLARGTVETLLSTRTTLQASVDYTIGDTVRQIRFVDLNAFSNDQIGQFSVLPEQFSAALSRRVVVDLIHKVLKRGDQIIFGVAWQRDNLSDQFSNRNFFVGSGDLFRDEFLAGGSCTNGERVFCETNQPDSRQTQWVVTGGYRRRVLRWLGLQVRGSHYNGETLPILKVNTDATVNPETSSYWNASVGIVVNLRALQ